MDFAGMNLLIASRTVPLNRALVPVLMSDPQLVVSGNFVAASRQAERSGRAEEGQQLSRGCGGEVDIGAARSAAQVDLLRIAVIFHALSWQAINNNAGVAVQIEVDALLVEFAHLRGLRLQHQIDTNSVQASSMTPVDAVTGIGSPSEPKFVWSKEYDA